MKRHERIVKRLKENLANGELYCDECGYLVENDECVWCGAPTRKAFGLEWINARASEVRHIISRDGEYLGSDIVLPFGNTRLIVNTYGRTITGKIDGVEINKRYTKDGMNLRGTGEEMFLEEIIAERKGRISVG